MHNQKIPFPVIRALLKKLYAETRDMQCECADGLTVEEVKSWLSTYVEDMETELAYAALRR